jgi:Tol biopolymer transport system component
VRICAAVAILAVVGASPAASAPRHTPASNGWIVFASDRTGIATSALRLYRLEPIGGAVTQLGQVEGSQPAWSPDGSEIAFVDERHRLAIASADGTGTTVLTSGRYPIREPSWSPDGSRIAFTQYTYSHIAGDIVVIATNGSGARRITNTLEDNSEPTSSPSGSRIAIASSRDPVRRIATDREIYLVRPDGSGLWRLTTNDFDDNSPAWSPDGRQLAFVSGRAPQGRHPELLLNAQRRTEAASSPARVRARRLSVLG